MNERTLRIGNVAAAAVAIGGALIIARPQYALGIVQLVLASVGAAAALYALAANVPPTGWLSPFKWMSPFNRAARPEERRNGWDEMTSLRSKLSGRRQQMRNAPPLPPEVVRLLKPLIRQTLDLDPEDEAQLASARHFLSPLAWAVLTSDPPTPNVPCLLIPREPYDHAVSISWLAGRWPLSACRNLLRTWPGRTAGLALRRSRPNR
jgi:hypothetical protein